MDSDAFKEGSHASQKMSAFLNRCIQGSVAKEPLVSAEGDKIRRLERRMSNSPHVRLFSAPVGSAVSSRSHVANDRLCVSLQPICARVLMASAETMKLMMMKTA
jgi:hypothetical protein